MYPFFSGLGGYIFGTNSAGNLDPSNIGVANKAFLKNAGLIDKWNKEGLINAALTYDTAQNAFLKKQAAFWITGPWDSQVLEQSGIKFKIIQLPKIVDASVPFLGVQGAMVTKYADPHGVGGLAAGLRHELSDDAGRAARRSRLRTAATRRTPWPARVSTTRSSPQFGKAGVGGVPMPNIPQMNSVWADLGAAWVKATKGAGATKAKTAFTAAARSIADKIG